jgi:hypothetical protein
VRFLIDAQLPPALARRLVALGHLADHVADIGMEAAADRAIWRKAAELDAVIITKDEDFIQDAFNKKYAQTGELTGAYGLADVVNAKLVRRAGDGTPAVTDGPYLETKEYIASFYLLDCENEERARQIAADIPWADEEPVELWPILHDASDDV